MELLDTEVYLNSKNLPDNIITEPQGTYSHNVIIQPFTEDEKDGFYFAIRLMLDFDDFDGNSGEISAVTKYKFLIPTGCVPYWANLVDFFEGAVGALLNLLTNEALPYLDLHKIPYAPLTSPDLRQLLLQAIDEVY